jgi:hypothetical protein
MDGFLKKRKLTDDSDVSANDKNLNLKIKRKYVDNYLCFGFSWNGDIDYILTVCIVSTVSPVIEELCKKYQSQMSN